MCDCSNDPQTPSQSTVLKDKDENTDEILETFETLQVLVNGFQVSIHLFSSYDLKLFIYSFIFHVIVYSVYSSMCKK